MSCSLVRHIHLIATVQALSAQCSVHVRVTDVFFQRKNKADPSGK